MDVNYVLTIIVVLNASQIMYNLERFVIVNIIQIKQCIAKIPAILVQLKNLNIIIIALNVQRVNIMLQIQINANAKMATL